MVNELVCKWLGQAIDTEIIRSPASNIGCPLSLSLPPVTSTCTAASLSALRGTYPSLSFVFYYWEHKENQFLKEVSILVPNRKQWVTLWAEMAIPEQGVVTHAQRCSEFPLFCGLPRQTRLQRFL